MKTKIAMAIATGTLLAATVLPAAAFAGGHKPPKPPVNKNSVEVKQINKSFVLTGVLSVAGTGGNTITGGTNTWNKWHQDENGGGDAKIITGDAKSVVKVTVGGSSNEATVDPCGCTPVTPTPEITGNGYGSHNSVTITTSNSTEVTQVNKSAIITLVGSIAGTGGNTISGNTGGDATINTGDATSKVTVEVTGSSNSLNPSP
ncbi:MAG: hypothetical protein A2W22_05005 [Candidatus Levybacteria bacterium RBG_16_35_11]|nr:MAG: hypothetical protein A2W22_05005 [Candidatus Levybacteria bacterium RBG_16_35_11]